MLSHDLNEGFDYSCSGLTTSNYTELSHIYEKYKSQGELKLIIYRAFFFVSRLSAAKGQPDYLINLVMVHDKGSLSSMEKVDMVP